MLPLSMMRPLVKQTLLYVLHAVGFGRPSWTFIGDGAEWSIDRDGQHTLGVMQRHAIKVKHAFLPCCINTKILHFGSLRSFRPKSEWRWIRAEKVVVTCFHGNFGYSDEMDYSLNKLLSHAVEVDRLIVSNDTMHQRFIQWGFPVDRLRKISVGVDTEHFIPVTSKTRALARKHLNIPKGHVVVGSFQKDGNGWQEGLDPKYEKGPDIFCDVIIALSREYPLHVLLTGPARGYVKNRLKSAGVSFTHHMLESPDGLVEYYHACDFYLMCSREEGGPKSVPEAMACGIPLVATRTGIARDVETNLKIGWFADIDDVARLIDLARHVILDAEGRNLYQASAPTIANACSWEQVGKAHLEIYKELIL